MKIAYVAGPYRAPTIRGVVENVRAAEAIAVELWRLGFAVVCPHLNSALLDGAVPDGAFLAGDLEILARCDLVVTAPNYGDSAGTLGELRRSAELGIPCFDWPEDRQQIMEFAR